MTLQEVIAQNLAQQQQARGLNARAGQTLFEVKTKEEIADFLKARLGGARANSEITDPETLCLPPLNQVEVDRVLQENPDSIYFSGEKFEVEYQAPTYYGTVFPPMIKLGESEGLWAKLPDEGLFLPGGRQLKVEVYRSWNTVISGTDVPEIKTKMLEIVNRQIWDKWEKPEIAVPEFQGEDVVVPFVVTSYGICAVTGQELSTYGTLQASRYWSSDQITWKAVWFRSAEKAEQVQKDSQQLLVETIEHAKELAEVAVAKAEAEAAREELKELSSGSLWSDLDHDLRRKVEDRTSYYSHLPTASTDLIFWAQETQELTKEVRVSLTEARHRKEASPRRLAELVKSVSSCPICQKRMDWELSVEQAKGLIEDGHDYNPCGCYVEDHVRSLSRHETWAGETVYTDKREAAVLHKVCVGGVAALSLVAYYKYGGWNSRWLVNEEGLRAEGEVTQQTLTRGSGVPHKPQAATPPKIVTFSDNGDGRHFSCSCGSLKRVTKSLSRSYKNGEEIEITCKSCGGSGKAQKSTESSAPETTQSEPIDMMAALRAKFGG